MQEENIYDSIDQSYNSMSLLRSEIVKNEALIQLLPEQHKGVSIVKVPGSLYGVELRLGKGVVIEIIKTQTCQENEGLCIKRLIEGVEDPDVHICLGPQNYGEAASQVYDLIAA